MQSDHPDTKAGFLFIAPTLLGYLVFVGGPILATLYFSFTRYDMLSPPEFSGLDNYAALLSDGRLHLSYLNTFFLTAIAVFLNVTLGLLLAVALNQHLPPILRYIFRTAYFFPILVAMIYVSMIWQFWFNKDLGVVNYYLGLLGVEAIPWLSSSQWALWSIIIVYVWKNVGFTMMITLAGLQNVDQDYYHAAEIDGAGSLKKFTHITIPLLSPILLFNIVISLINTLQEFDSIVVLTNGGPGDASRSIVLYLYEVAFKSFEMGYASTIALTLFVIIMTLTVLQFWVSNKWVHYD